MRRIMRTALAAAMLAAAAGPVAAVATKSLRSRGITALLRAPRQRAAATSWRA